MRLHVNGHTYTIDVEIFSFYTMYGTITQRSDRRLQCNDKPLTNGNRAKIHDKPLTNVLDASNKFEPVEYYQLQDLLDN